MKTQKFSVLYIDLETFKNIQSKDFSLAETVKAITGNEDSKKISVLTKNYLKRFNNFIDECLKIETCFDSCVVGEGVQSTKTTEDTYVEERIINKLSNAFGSGLTAPYADTPDTIEQPPKCFEIFTVSESSVTYFLVVVQDGFLDFLIESKDNLKGFVLNLLDSLYRYNLDIRGLVKYYLKLELDPYRFDYIKTTVKTGIGNRTIQQ